MPVAAVALLVLLVGNLILGAAILARRRAGRDLAAGLVGAPAEPGDLAIELAPDHDGRSAAGSGIRPATYDRVIRIASYAFLVVTAVVVAAGGLWPSTAPAIYLLLFVAAGVVFVLHELAFRAAEVSTLFLVEGVLAVTFFTLLIVLTGGATSPFFFGYFLIVAAAALVTGGGANLVLAAGITAAYLGALLLVRDGQSYTTEQVVVVAIDVIALWLLSYLASVVAGEQRRTRDAALRLSLHDPLTRLYNRTFLFAVIEREIARAGRTNRRFSLLMLDLDGLKPINDRFGHYFGDRMLQAVAEAVRQGIRVIDSSARYGGDEFVVLLPETDTEGAAVVAEKLRRSVAAIRLNAGTEVLNTTASIGVVAFPEDGRTADALTNRADQVMYAAKRAGRNRVRVEGQPHGPAPAPVLHHPKPDTDLPGRARKGGASSLLGRTLSARRTPARVSPQHSTAAGVATPGGGSSRRTPRAAEPRPSMFTESYPTLPRWVLPRPLARPWAAGLPRTATPLPAPTAQPPAANAIISTGAASAATSSRGPTVRARRFRVEHPQDRTFDRTMRFFLRGRDQASGPGSAKRRDRGA